MRGAIECSNEHIWECSSSVSYMWARNPQDQEAVMAICSVFIHGLVGKLIISENGPDPEQ